MNRHWLYEIFEDEYPSLARQVVNIWPESSWSFIVELGNGSRYRYDGVYHNARLIPSDSDNLSEDECRNEFGIRLRSIMRRKGYTQQLLAKETGLSQKQVSEYMTGKRTPSFYAVDRIAKALRCSVDEFRYV